MIPASGHAALSLVSLGTASECDQLSQLSMKINQLQTQQRLPSSYSEALIVHTEHFSVEEDKIVGGRL